MCAWRVPAAQVWAAQNFAAASRPGLLISTNALARACQLGGVINLNDDSGYVRA